MSNPLFNALSGNNNPMSNMQNMINQFKQFKQTFTGDPQQTITKMLQNGQITQAQLDQAKQMANQFKGWLK